MDGQKFSDTFLNSFKPQPTQAQPEESLGAQRKAKGEASGQVLRPLINAGVKKIATKISGA